MLPGPDQSRLALLSALFCLSFFTNPFQLFNFHCFFPYFPTFHILYPFSQTNISCVHHLSVGFVVFLYGSVSDSVSVSASHLFYFRLV